MSIHRTETRKSLSTKEEFDVVYSAFIDNITKRAIPDVVVTDDEKARAILEHNSLVLYRTRLTMFTYLDAATRSKKLAELASDIEARRVLLRSLEGLTFSERGLAVAEDLLPI